MACDDDNFKLIELSQIARSVRVVYITMSYTSYFPLCQNELLKCINITENKNIIDNVCIK